MEKAHTNDSLIPIMMITWNRLAYTKKAIKALFDNTRHPFVLWIWDNGSTDGTAEYLKSFNDSRVQVIFSVENVGLVPPMNEFFRRYKDSEYLSKVDNDTIVPVGWLTKLKNVMDNFPLFVVASDHYLGLPYKLKNNQEFYDQLAKVEFEGEKLYLYVHCGGSGILIRRKHIDKPIESVRGALSGWVDYQVDKCAKENLRCAFYSGVFIERFDFTGTNKPKIDYPEYSKKINKMRSGKEVECGFGIVELDMEALKTCREWSLIKWR